MTILSYQSTTSASPETLFAYKRESHEDAPPLITEINRLIEGSLETTLQDLWHRHGMGPTLSLSPPAAPGTVAHLRQLLQDMPPEASVVIEDYTGLWSCTRCEEVLVTCSMTTGAPIAVIRSVADKIEGLVARACLLI